MCLQLRNLRFDNLNAFMGACVDPGNICIVSEYSSKGSLQDIMANDDVKLDQMFISSLVFDIIRVNTGDRLYSFIYIYIYIYQN